MLSNAPLSATSSPDPIEFYRSLPAMSPTEVIVNGDADFYRNI